MKKILLSALLGAVAFGSLGLFAACGSEEAPATTTPTPSYKENTSVTDVSDVEYTYDEKGDITSWTQGAKLYTAKYLLKGESASYVELAGAKPEELEIVGYHGAIDELSIADIEKSVTIDGKAISVSGIKANAFYGCSTLKKVDLSKKNKSLNFNIGARAFYNCTALTEFKFPEEVFSVGNEIGSFAFAGCAALKEISVPANFNSIGDGAFANCVELARVTLPDTVEIISRSMFYMDDKLASFSGAKNARSIQNQAFYGTALTGFNFNNYTKLTYIGDMAFGNTLLTEVVVPQSVGYIGYQAFYNLESLTKVEIPFLGYSVNKIYDYNYGSWTFEGNYGLSGLKVNEKDEREIAVSVTAAVQIGDSAFAGLESVKSITITNFIAEGRYEVYDDEGLVQTRVEVEPNYVIGNRAFENCHNLTALSLPQGVTAIGDNAFLYCYNMESISLQSGLESIGDNALRGCRKLSAIELPATVKEIGDRAFYGCRELANITFPESVTKLGTAVLGDCASLKSITIKKAWNVASAEQDDGSVEYSENQLTIGRNLFATTTPSEFINADEMYKTSESEYAYNIPTSLTSFTVEGVKYIPENAFNGMRNLTNVSISYITEKDVPDNYKTYYNRKYGKAYKLETNIGGYAFYDCRKLSAVTVPETATSIGDSAFYGCREITAFTLPESVTNIGNAILGDCIKLKTLTVEKWDGLKSVAHNNEYGDVYYTNDYYTIGSLNRLFSSSSTYRNEKWKEFTESDEYDSGSEYFYNTVLSVYQTAGYYQGSYSSVYLPKSLTSVVVDSVCQIPSCAFNGWTYLQSVDLSFVRGYKQDSISTERFSHTPNIGTYAFYNCAALAEIDATDGKEVKKIETHAFDGCGNVIGSVFTAFPQVEYIGGYAMANSTYSGKLTLPESLTYIGTGLLQHSYNITELEIAKYTDSYRQITYNDYGSESVTNVGYAGKVLSLFDDSMDAIDEYYNPSYNYYRLATVTLKGVTRFATGALCDMGTVKTVTIEGTVDSDGLNSSVFNNMSSLEKLNYTLPFACYNSGSSYIGILEGCSKLQEVSVQLPTYSTTAYLARLFNYSNNTYLPASLTTVKLETPVVEGADYYIPGGILSNAYNVTNVEFAGNRIKAIGAQAFTGSGVFAVKNYVTEEISDGVYAGSCVLNGWVIGSCVNIDGVYEDYSSYYLFVPTRANRANINGIAYGVLPNNASNVYYNGSSAEWDALITKSTSSPSNPISFDASHLYVHDTAQEWTLYVAQQENE